METSTSLRSIVVRLGRELEFASGIRAAASEYAMKMGETSTEGLFETLEETINSAWLYESYHRITGGKLVLGQDMPFPSLEAYLTLHAHFGENWLTLGMTEYARYYGALEYRRAPELFAEQFVEQARRKYAKAIEPPLPRALATFGKEFEVFGGLRPLALSELLSAEHPHDCPDIMTGVCISEIGEALTHEGTADFEELYEICNDCYTVREYMGHGDWVKEGLRTYLTKVKGLSGEDADVECERLMEMAKRRYAEAVNLLAPIKNAEQLQALLRQEKRYETDLAELRQQIEILSAA